MLEHKFVEFIPDKVEEGVLYISIEYCTTIHKCVCGCGNEVVTPLSPTDWRLSFNGKTVSLYPSIGNWNFDCQSHYWIKNNKIEFSDRWTKDQIDFGRENDMKKKVEYFEKVKSSEEILIKDERVNIWRKILNFFKI